MTRTITSRGDWIQAAIRAMREGGVAAVRVEALAKDLGITKGSFYWHFEDHADLLAEVLTAWEDETAGYVAEASQQDGPAERLQAFFRLASERAGNYPPDVEILAWARWDEDVAALARKVEGRRLAFIRKELERAGFDGAEARRRARIAYLATQGWILQAGYGAQPTPRLADFTSDLFDLLLELPSDGEVS